VEFLVRCPPVARISRDRPRRPICVANCHDYSGGLCGCPADFPAVSAEGFSQVDIIDAAGVLEHLPMSECIGMMAKAMIAVSEGASTRPARTIMPLVDGSAYLGIMPGSLSSPRVCGVKVVSLHPANASAGRPTIHGVVILFDHHTGRPLAAIDGAEITALRTGAASALATRLLARPDSLSLGLFGSGAQAGSHLEAICAVRTIAVVRVWSRKWQHACAFAERYRGRFGVDVVPVEAAEDAAACDIVSSVTSATEPIISGTWLRPGAHVNLVGAHSPKTRESDTALIENGSIYVDSLESALSEAGDILIPIEEGAIDASHIVGEIGAVACGRIAGRATPEQITVYKSVGVVAQDLVAAHAIYLSYCRKLGRPIDGRE
jgi:ornithine cyclodeaminase/alanine dehydrogenase-like protein (mu-crystallin family)